MSETLKIQAGPFKGFGPTAVELRPLLDSLGQPVIREGKPLDIWGVHHKTPHVLDVFKPIEGWGIVVTDRAGPFEIPDPNTRVSDGKGGETIASQPTTIFTAELVNPEGRTVASASVLCIINSTYAWSDGVNHARSKLYIALGLTTPSEPVDLPPASGTPNVKPAAVVAGVTAIQAPSKHDKLPAVAQAVIEQAVAASQPVEPTAPAEATPVGEPKVVAFASSQDVGNGSVNQSNPALNKNLLRQAEHRARLHRVEVPAFANDDEIRAFCKNLLKKVG